MSLGRRWGAWALLLLLLASGLLAMKRVARDGQGKEVVMSLREYLINSFVQELPEINRKLPHRIDEHTTLQSIAYAQGKVISRYQLHSSAAIAGFSEEQLRRLKFALTQQVCRDEFKQKLLDVDVLFLESYQDASNQFLFETLVKKSDCVMP